MSDNNIDEYHWFEIWAEELRNPSYLLILFSNTEDTKFDIYDPIEKEIAAPFNSYKEAQFWLWEDEFTKVKGRVVPNEM